MTSIALFGTSQILYMAAATAVAKAAGRECWMSHQQRVLNGGFFHALTQEEQGCCLEPRSGFHGHGGASPSGWRRLTPASKDKAAGMLLPKGDALYRPRKELCLCWRWCIPASHGLALSQHSYHQDRPTWVHRSSQKG